MRELNPANVEDGEKRATQTISLNPSLTKSKTCNRRLASLLSNVGIRAWRHWFWFIKAMNTFLSSLVIPECYPFKPRVLKPVYVKFLAHPLNSCFTKILPFFFLKKVASLGQKHVFWHNMHSFSNTLDRKQAESTSFLILLSPDEFRPFWCLTRSKVLQIASALVSLHKQFHFTVRYKGSFIMKGHSSYTSLLMTKETLALLWLHKI